jgi:hypothetical protein
MKVFFFFFFLVFLVPVACCPLALTPYFSLLPKVLNSRLCRPAAAELLTVPPTHCLVHDVQPIEAPAEIVSFTASRHSADDGSALQPTILNL